MWSWEIKGMGRFRCDLVGRWGEGGLDGALGLGLGAARVEWWEDARPRI